SSVGAGGLPDDRGTFAQAMSANGRYIAFATDATNFDPADTDGVRDLYWRDLRTGEVRLVSRATGQGGVKANDHSFGPSISADGRYVAWHTGATNLSPDDSDNVMDVYMRDVAAGTTT